MPHTTLRVDWENNTEEFWESLRLLRSASEAHQALALLLDQDELTRPEDEAETLLAVARTLPGWSHPKAPEYAPHPIIWSTP